MLINMNYDYIFKVVIIGDSNTGKTSLINRYVNNYYSDETISTIGVDFKLQSFNLGNKHIKLQLWDTAGQERFKSLTTSYYRSADGIIILFDITNRTSFENIKIWLNEVNKYNNEAVILLVSTKSDMELKRVISNQEITELCTLYKLPHIETSSKLNINIEKVFLNLSQLMINAKINIDEKPILNINDKHKIKSLIEFC